MSRAAILAVACFVLASSAAGGSAEPASMSAAGSGRAWASFSSRGVDATLEGALEISFLGLCLRGFGHGQGILDLPTFAGWGWAVVWGQSAEVEETDAEGAVEIVGGLAVERSPALGSGSVTGTCAFVVRQNGSRREYRGTFVTQAESHLVPADRLGTLALEGEIAITFTLLPCPSDAPLPWDSTRWPAALWSEFESRFAPQMPCRMADSGAMLGDLGWRAVCAFYASDLQESSSRSGLRWSSAKPWSRPLPSR